MAPESAADRPGRHRRFRMARRWIFYVLVRSLAELVRVLPRAWSGTLLAGLGSLAWRIRPHDRELTLRQLGYAFPELSTEQRRAMGCACFVLFGRNLADSVRAGLPVSIAPEDDRRFTRAANSGRPLLLLALHLGCWEQLGRWLALRLEKMGTVTANPHNHWVDRWLRNERSALGLRTFDRRREPLGAARWLRRGHPLAILADHRGQVESVDAEFFGYPAPTAVGPARLARRCGACILPVGITREGSGHRVLVGHEIQWSLGDDDVTVATRCNAALEDLIRRAPTEWTWFHDRYGELAPAAPGRERP